MKLVPIATMTLAACLSCPALAARIAKTPWTGSNATALNKSTKAEVAKFLDTIGGSVGTPAALLPNNIQQFEWIDLAGDGKCELVLTLNGGPNFTSLGIFWQNSKGDFHSQSLPGGINLKPESST